MSKLLLPVIAILLSLQIGCAVNPVTGERQLSLMSPEQEVQIGEKYYQSYQQQQGGAYIVDPQLTPYIASVGQKLARLSDRPDLPYEFVVLNSDVPNAWALPGGKIAINRGLLVLLEDEAQLAAVLGHEIVHAAARHGASQQTRQTLLGLSVAAIGIASAKSDYGPWLGLGAAAGGAAWQAHYSRSHELEADNYGIDYMVAAGYDPQAAVELQETFVKLSQGSKSDIFSALFASHPPSVDRVAKNRAKAAKLTNGKRNREAYQKAIAQIKRDAPAYKLHREALEEASKNQLEGALIKVDKAIKLQPKEASFHITRGQLLLAQKNTKSAESAFAQAYKLDPNYYVSSLGLGLSEKLNDKMALAKQHLEKSVAIIPTQIAIYHLGEIELANGNRSKASQYFKAVAQAGGKLGQAATEKLEAMASDAQ